MSSHDDDRSGVGRRRLLQSAASVGVIGGTANARSHTLGGDGGDGGGNDGGGGGGDGGGPGGDGGRGPWVAVTLVTGQTVHVTVPESESDDADADREDDEQTPGVAAAETPDERVVVLDDDVDGTLHVVERDEGVYVIPADVDLDVYSEELFNVDRLIADGLTDAETDAVPVIVRHADTLVSGGVGALTQAEGFEAPAPLESIDAVAGAVRKDRAAATSQGLAAASGVDRVYLDAEYEAVLDESASAVGAGAAREEFDVDGSGVSVGVVDTGVDADHPDFGDRVVHERDFTGEGTQDDYGHGTHVAGIAAGDGSENGDYVGVAPGADLLNLKVLGADGRGRTSAIVRGIEHAVERGVDVVNLSLGGSPAVEDDPLVDAVDYAAAEGVLPVVSAGNLYFSADHETISSPGVAAGALTVGASDDDSSWFFASAAGPTTHDHRVKPEVVAPGVGVTAAGSESAGEAPYTSKTGTSMSAPHVSGAAALLIEERADWSPDRVKSVLTATADATQDESIYHRGAGRVDARAALDADVVVRDAVTSFGILTEPTEQSATIAVENVGDDEVELDVAASLTNVQTDEDLDDAVTVTPGTLVVPAGEVAELDLDVAAVETYGYNAGELELSDGDRTYAAMFGFSLGLQFEVERIPHPDRSGGGGFLQGFTHDGSTSYGGGFGSANTAAFETFDPAHVEEGVDVSFWSFDVHPTEDATIVTIETTRVGPDDTSVVMDETETVPTYLDTDPVSHHEPFHVEVFSESVHANFGDGVTQGFTAFGSIPDADTPTWYTPIDEDSVVNVANRYVLVPEAERGSEGALDSPTVYNLMYPMTSISGPEAPIEVSEATLAADHLTYYRTPAEETLTMTPITFPRPYEQFPGSIWVGKSRTIGQNRVEQTIYRSDDTEYEETWYDEGISDLGWQAVRFPDHRQVDPGDEYDMQLDRGPLQPELDDWEFSDGTLSARTYWYADQSNPGFNVYHYDRYDLDPDDLNELLVDVDGDRVIDFRTRVPGVRFGGVDADPGSTVTVTLRGNHMLNIDRGTRTEAEYEVTYGHGSNAPPAVDLVEVAGLDAHNQVPTGRLVVFVDVEDRGRGVDSFRAYAAETGTTSGSPFDDPAGWTPAETVYVSGSRYGVRVDATRADAGLDLAVAATDGAGNRVRSTTFEAIETTSGASRTAPVDVRPSEIHPGSNGVVPVVVEPTDGLDPHRIDPATLRFGAPGDVFAGDGAAPHRTQRLGNGALQAEFRARETGYTCDQDVAVGQLVADFDDGTTVSGVDVVPSVVCRRPSD